MLCVAVVLAASLAAEEPSPAPPAYGEEVAVERVLMEVRIVDSHGRPVRGLGPADLRLAVDGHAVEPDSLEWIDAATPNSLPPGAVLPVPDGRAVVFLFQKDLHGSRNAGLLRMLRRAREVVDRLPVADRVAVASFDTRLHVWADLTRDRKAARDAIDGGVLGGHVSMTPPGEGPTLAVAQGGAALAGATSIEKAMRLLADAMSSVPGDRSLVLVGSYLGRNPSTIVGEDYESAMRALSRSRVAVYSLDVTEADHHTLEMGLQTVAADTGGFYARTHDFAAQATDRLSGALEGHYLLSFPRPELPAGFHEVQIKLVQGRPGEVLSRQGYQD